MSIRLGIAVDSFFKQSSKSIFLPRSFIIIFLLAVERNFRTCVQIWLLKQETPVMRFSALSGKTFS